MSNFSVNTAQEYPKTSRTVLSGNNKSLVSTFERIRSDSGDSNVVKVKDEENVLYSARVNLDAEEGSGYWEFIQVSDDLYIIAADYQYIDTRSESVLGEDFLEFHFKVSGELLLEVSDGETLSVRGPSLLIWKQPSGCNIREWMKGGVRESSLTLYCKPRLFTERLGFSPEQLPSIVQSFVEGKNSSIEYDVIPLNPALGFSITNLLRSNMGDKFHLIHTRAKTIDLLCDILQYLHPANTADDEDAMSLSSYEQEQLQKARDILSTTFNPPPTIKALARKIGLNETKFKKGFKKLFGSTIHEYSNYHRMQKALELLQTSELTISEIAQSVGYEYQTSFTAAVKHFFGVTPKQLRQNNKRG